MLIAPVVDPALVKDTTPSLQIAYKVLDEMALVGNKIAASRLSELNQLEKTLRALEAMPLPDPTTDSAIGLGASEGGIMPWVDAGSTGGDSDLLNSHGWEFEEGLSGQQLEAVADNLNLTGLDWLWNAGSLDHS